MNKDLVMLVAEDDPNDITLLRHALKRNGIAAQVQIVADGDQAIKYLRREGKYADRAAFPFPEVRDRPLDMLLSDLGRLDRFDPANPFIARQGRNVFPLRQGRFIGRQAFL